MSTNFDIVIVGGGVMGCSVAFHLKTLEPNLSVLVLERDPSYAKASSALSASSIRQQFSVPINVLLSQHSFDFFRDISRHLSVDGSEVDIGLVERGYLYLASEAAVENLRRSHEVQFACGARTQLVDRSVLANQFPWLSTEGVSEGCLGLHGEGWFDGYSLLQAFRHKARSLGVTFRAAEVTALSFLSHDSAIVRTFDGEEISCGAVVNAAGPHAALVAGMADLALPVAPEKHCIFVFECPEKLPDCPLVVDPSGLYFRPEGTRFIVGPPLGVHHEPGDDTLDVDHALFDDVVWPTLAKRVPAFEAIRCVSAWAGFYEMNTFDQNALLGRAPGFDNFYLINGFSGHGIQQSPAAGLALAELLVHGSFRKLDATPLSPKRLVTNTRLRELNVI